MKAIAALNSIIEIAPNIDRGNRLSALTQNNFYLSFNDNEIVTMIKFENAKKAREYFRRNASPKKEVIKSYIFDGWLKWKK